MFNKLFSYIQNGLRSLFFKKRIYLDYASLTPIDPRVIAEVKKFSSMEYGNPSSFYREGVKAKEVLKNSRAEIASFICSEPDEIYFTSGGTESNNIAILGTIESLHDKGVEYEKMHVLISIIEHSSIRECANALTAKGVKVELIPVNKEGIVDVDEVRKMIKPNTVIVSVMMVNNELGSVQPIREIAKVIRHYRSNATSTSDFNFQDFAYPVFHTDASQAFLYEPLNVAKLGVDILTLDSSKVYGPRGIGLIFIKKDTPVSPIIFGGGQESGLRSGTENIGAIRGFAKALEISFNDKENETKRIMDLREYFASGLKKIREDIIFNGPVTIKEYERGYIEKSEPNCSPHILNVTIPKIDNEFFVLQLDAKGICCSTKSSCLGDEAESYVLNAIGANSKESVRFSFGRWTTRKDIDKVLNVIGKIISN